MVCCGIAAIMRGRAILSDSSERLDFLESLSVAASHARNSNVMRDMKDTENVLIIHYLEMLNSRALPAKQSPPGFEFALVAPPSPILNRQFYVMVGGQWNWTDRLKWLDDDWCRYVNRSVLQTWVGYLHGESIGYCELELQSDGNMEIAYFGLLPEFVGRGLGGVLLTAAVERAWLNPEVRRVWLHTCTDDHPNALENYRKRGFTLYKTEKT